MIQIKFVQIHLILKNKVAYLHTIIFPSVELDWLFTFLKISERSLFCTTVLGFPASWFGKPEPSAITVVTSRVESRRREKRGNQVSQGASAKCGFC